MRIDVTFSLSEMVVSPTFDTTVSVPVANYTALLDSTIGGEFVNDEVTSLKYAAFYNCANLTSISLPNCVSADSGYTFNGCNKVETINLPQLASITGSAARAFYSMHKVQEINLPELTTAPNMSSTFELCRVVKKINMPKLSGTSLTRTFYNCYELHTVVLGGSTLNTMVNTNAFTNAGRDTTTGTGLRIYVPDDMVDAYKTATNWTAYADKIKPMSELEE